MHFVQFSKLSLAFGDRDILKDASARFDSKTRAALAGANGSGKTTLLRIMAGALAPDSGERAISKGCRIAYLPQSGIVHKGRTLREELERVCKVDGAAAGPEAAYRVDAAISSALTGLGFAPGDLEREAGAFSAGWQMRIALAKVLLQSPDLLLLDEPTNYLDIEARAWLEKWIARFEGGVILVSHDRYFLDRSVNEVYELFRGRLKRYAGNYSAYETVRAQELEYLQKQYNLQQVEIAKTESLIRRFRYKATKAAFVQELIKRLGKMEKIEIPESLEKITLTLPEPPHSGRVACTLDAVGKRYGALQALAGVSLTLDAGERLLVAGPNGAGKSTLLRIIAGADTRHEGKVTLGAGVVAGYFSQDDTALAAGSETVEAFVESRAPAALVPRVRGLCAAFLFRGDAIHKPLSVLSGGEKSRLALLAMLLEPRNLLVLDEPTNHLDLHSKDVLLDALRAFSGTIVFVSHDRAFMEALSTKTLELRAGEPRLFYGNYAYYLERIAREEGEGAAAVSARPAACAAQAPSEWHTQKQRQALLRKAERAEQEALAETARLEAEKARAEAALARPEIYSSPEKAAAAAAAIRALDAAIAESTARWEQAAAALAGNQGNAD
jgi:ATP-binding cassette subfamily F protein 3